MTDAEWAERVDAERYADAAGIVEVREVVCAWCQRTPIERHHNRGYCPSVSPSDVCEDCEREIARRLD